VNGDDRIKVVVQEYIGDKVVFLSGCKKQHEGDVREMEGVKEKLKILDGRMWSLIVMALFQCAGLIAVLLKTTR